MPLSPSGGTADTTVSKTVAERCAGSNPASDTRIQKAAIRPLFCCLLSIEAVCLLPAAIEVVRLLSAVDRDNLLIDDGDRLSDLRDDLSIRTKALRMSLIQNRGDGALLIGEN